MPSEAIEALLPCPFCGGEAELVQADNDPRRWIVTCAGFCEVQPSVEVASREGAVASWNQRAERARGPVELSDDALDAAYRDAYVAWFSDGSPDAGSINAHWAGLRAVARAARGDKP